VNCTGKNHNTFVSEIVEGLLESENDVKNEWGLIRLINFQIKLGIENQEPTTELASVLSRKRGKESEFTTRII
jgi:hypothetical protein